ncbi:Hypothetical protein, putative [Bodo saltans]|uniref:Uncharacterized protein n=1 Tax=Bodo saltans TaxID=75058 RepID=A0A0S4IYZ8_BODSA|nr:Hypothetical protein, putative [Bodo saltans]|eukprot:CUG27638.1 Hypothetical protein, putative [Bodo saltans]
MNDATKMTSGAPIHCLMLPVYHGIETKKGKKAHNKFCEVTAAVDAVIRQLSLGHKRALEITMCPRRPQICCAHIAPKKRSAPQPGALTLPTNDVYLYEIGCGELRRAVVAASLLSIIDVVFLYCPDDEVMKEFKADTVKAHVQQYLMPLLLGMGVRRIEFVVRSESAKEVWEPTLATWKEHTKWNPHHTSLAMTIAPEHVDTRAAATPADDAPNPAGWVGAGTIACFTKTISEILASSQPLATVEDNARRPLRLSVLRRFDKIGVLVCQVLQGTLKVGDRVISVHDPLRTCTGNRVVSIRVYPLNCDVTEAFPGEQVGILTEAQLTFQNAHKTQLSQLPFLSLGQGDMIVRYGEGPQTQPCWLVVTSDVKVEEGKDLTLFGHGGNGLMRVVQRKATSLALTHTEYTWGQGLFIEAPVASDVESEAAAATEEVRSDNDDGSFRKVYTTDTLLAATHSNCQEERVFFPVRVRAVRHRMWVHRFIVGHVLPFFDPHALDKLPSDTVHVMLQKWRTTLEPPTGVNDGMKLRYTEMVFDELSQLVPKDLLLTCFPAAASATTNVADSTSREAAAALMSAQMDLLMLVSRLPVRDVAGRIWDYLASVLTSDAAPKKRQYFVTPTDRGPTALHNVALPPNFVNKILMRSVRSTFWLTRVRRIVGGTEKGLSVTEQWKLLELQEGSGVLRDMVGPSVRRQRPHDANAKRGVAEGMKISLADRASLLRAVLESPNGVSAATLYTSLACLAESSAFPQRQSSRWEWTDEEHVVAWQQERSAHTNFYVSALLVASKSSETVSHLSRWCLAAGILIPKLTDMAKQLPTLKSFHMLQRMTFVDLETLYVTQWALLRRHGVSLQASIMHKIAHYLLLMISP